MGDNRVLVIMTTPLCHDGLTKMVMEIYRHSSRKRVKFDFVISSKGEEEYNQELISGGASIYYLLNRRKSVFCYIKDLIKCIKNNKYKIIHIHGNSALMFIDVLAAKLGGATKIITHCHNSASQFPVIHYLLKPIFNLLVTDKVACSKLAGNWAYFNKFTIVHNGICVNKFIYNRETRIEYRKKLGILENTILFGHVGRFSKQKNHKYLIDIFNEIRNINNNSKLLLIGDGELKKEINNKIKSLDLEEYIICLGNSQEVNNYMQAMDILFLPSLYEGLGIVGIEAQAAGLPCIVSDSVSDELKITDLVKFMSLSQSSKEWAEVALHAKLGQRKDMKKIIEEKGYSIEKTVYELYEIYDL